MPAVVLTRPDNQSLSALCRQQGWQVFDLPVFERVALPKPDLLLSHYDMVFMINSYVAKLFYHHYADSIPEGLIFGAAGLSTASTLEQLGAKRIWHTQNGQDSEHFWQYLYANGLHVDLKSVLIVRAQEGRDWLADRLREVGIQVDYLPLYTRQIAVWQASQIESLKQLEPYQSLITVLTSAQAVAIFCQKIADKQLAHLLKHVLITHERFASLLWEQCEINHWEKPQIYLSAPQENKIILTLRSILNTI